MAKNILMIVGDYVEDYEAMVPFQMLKMVGHNVHVISPGVKPGDKVKTAVHDFLPGEQSYTERAGHNFAVNTDFDSAVANLNQYHGILIPGGRAPEYLRLNAKVMEAVTHFFHAKKPVAAVCHGPLIFVGTDLVKGKKLTAYPACGPDLKAAGAHFDSTCPMDGVVVSDDGLLITACAWPAHPAWVGAFLKALGTKITL